MNNAQRKAWNAEFGVPKFPYLGYSQERELTSQEYEALRQHQLSKLEWCRNVQDKIGELFYKHFCSHNVNEEKK